MDGWGNRCVKNSREIWVPKGELSIICSEIQSGYLRRTTRFRGPRLSDVVVEPLCACLPRSVAIISVVVTCHMLENIVHSLC